jgi:CRP-like cAMP-binding protein
MELEIRTRRKVQELLERKLKQHATLTTADCASLKDLPFHTRPVRADQDVVCQGDRPKHAVFVIDGMLARYHTLPSGVRQYLSFHIRSDLPDIQSLFLEVMDHSVSALNDAHIACFPHEPLLKLFLERPGVAFGFWRAMLVEAAVLRQAITNNSARHGETRLAHFFYEQHAKARIAGVAKGGTCHLPLTQSQLGQTLAMSHITVNRTLQKLRSQGAFEFRDGVLHILNQAAAPRIAEFDPTYLHVSKESEVATTPFDSRI